MNDFCNGTENTMIKHTPTLAFRLRAAATLLLSLPAIVAAACFAHGHGALGSAGLLAVLAAAIAAGAAGAYLALSPLRSNRLSSTAAPRATAVVSHI